MRILLAALNHDGDIELLRERMSHVGPVTDIKRVDEGYLENPWCLIDRALSPIEAVEAQLRILVEQYRATIRQAFWEVSEPLAAHQHLSVQREASSPVAASGSSVSSRRWTPSGDCSTVTPAFRGQLIQRIRRWLKSTERSVASGVARRAKLWLLAVRSPAGKNRATRTVSRTSAIATALSALVAWSPPPLHAADDEHLNDCRRIGDVARRVTCYDAIAPEPGAVPADMHLPARLPAKQVELPVVSPAGAGVSPMSARWELANENKNGLWSFRPHKPNYFLFGRLTSNVNRSPYAVFLDEVNDPDVELSRVEAKYQLSFKVKFLEDVARSGTDLWIGYTQQSHWQVYSKRISAPFRETNYEPEVFAVVPLRFSLAGLNARFAGVGVVHQSNGQSNLLSRSWNRVFAQVGLERNARLAITMKAWHRLPESAANDDNPGITDYVGDFEVIGSYRIGRHTLSAIGRSNFGASRGFLQIDWTHPLHDKLKAYLQCTSGYGESLIDYNHRQSTLGVGVMLTDWM